MPVSLRARLLVPIDGPPIENGMVTVDGERIRAVGPARSTDQPLIDLGDVALLPGLVNAHTHLEFSHLRRPLGGRHMELANWIPLVISERRRRSFVPQRAIQLGSAESLRRGVTTLGEIATAAVTEYRLDLVAPELLLFQEVIGFSRARAESVLSAARIRLNEAADGQRLGLSPHAPYTVSRQLVARLVKLAAERNLPVAMHLAESPAELELLETGGGAFRELLNERSMWDEAALDWPSRPLDYLQILKSAPRALVVHGNYLADDEFDLLAQHRDRFSLVHCPRTHAYFGHPSLRLDELHERGVRIALGTDSRASNPDLCLLGEMRAVSGGHPQLSPSQILGMGTLAGAEALGRAHEVGSLTTGKLANLTTIPLPPNSQGNAEDLCAALLASDESPSATWLRGMPCRPVLPT